MNIQSYKNIIFDLGGVIIDIDPAKAVEAFAAHTKKTSPADIQQLYKKIVDGRLLMDYEKGLIDDSQFRTSLNEKLDINLSDQEFDNAFNALLLDYKAERLALIDQLRKTHNILLLSNTCHIHYVFYNNLLKTKYGYSDFSHLFHKMYLSFEMGMRKPDTKIFRQVIEDSNLDTSETIFIDDSKQNIESAKAAGISGYHKPSDVELTSIF